MSLLLQDARDMVEIFTGRMPFLFDALLADPALVHLLQQLLIPAGPAPVSTAVSRHVAPILLQYLVEHRLTDLQQPSSKVCAEHVSLASMHSWQMSLIHLS